MKRVESCVSIGVRKFICSLFVLLSVSAASVSYAEIMPLSQVRKGMKGYGLTVFDGTKVERFDVEVLGVLNNIGPRQDLILVRVDSPVTKKSGVIAGMSGSPIYLDGKVIGALAYSWQFSSDAIAGVTPIEEMLLIGEKRGNGLSPAPVAPRLNAASILSVLGSHRNGAQLQQMMDQLAPPRMAASSGALPISTPVSFSRFAPETLDRFGRWFEASGFMAVPSGSTAGGSSRKAAAGGGTFQPGDAIAGILVDGDFSVAATGTVTHIDGQRVYAFGHPFMDMGEINFPMARSEVVAVLPNLARSFKFVNSGEVVGALRQDRYAGILGVLGQDADMIPVELTLDGAGSTESYHMRVIRNPQLSPMMIAMAADTVVASTQRAAGERTVVLESEIDLEGLPPIRLREGWAGAEARQAIPAYLAIVSSYLLSNEFRAAEIKSVKIHLHHDDTLKIARLIDASVDSTPDGEIHPGDTVRLRTRLKPFRGEVFTETFDVHIPESQKPGTAYLFVGSGAAANQLDFSIVPPDPQTLEQVLGVLERLRASTDLIVGLYSESEGAVTAGVYQPDLPPSVQAMLDSDASSGPKAPVRYSSAEKMSHHLDYIVDGALKVDLEVRPKL
jgi:hypothetical protein